ncbi:hypothetical protein FJZ28_04540, partial [Candidatus Peregrinibacteria bacterium]|nr:hypothetical protein [Candidatus Peregrinibacteria bacterium]
MHEEILVPIAGEHRVPVPPGDTVETGGNGIADVPDPESTPVTDIC